MANTQTVLITGGSGLVGQHLTNLLLGAGYRVTHLSRSANGGQVPVYQWDVEAGTIDEKAISEADHIIHLAGAGIADKRWTSSRKKVIMDSRVQSTALLARYLQQVDRNVQSFISASAIGYYGDRGSEVLTEQSKPGSGGFLEEVCVAWEEATKEIDALGIRTASIRIGLVLAKEGGALPKVVLPMQFGLAPYFGDGEQFYSWIHITDLVRLFQHVLENPTLSNVYNGVVPEAVTNKAFTHQVKKALGKFALLLPAPAFALRLAMGQMADVVLYSAKVYPEATLQAGFTFQYTTLQSAIADLYQRV